jgi:hypothetical protein
VNLADDEEEQDGVQRDDRETGDEEEQEDVERRRDVATVQCNNIGRVSTSDNVLALRGDVTYAPPVSP